MEYIYIYRYFFVFCEVSLVMIYIYICVCVFSSVFKGKKRTKPLELFKGDFGSHKMGQITSRPIHHRLGFPPKMVVKSKGIQVQV